jgi:hypothetical protein
MKYYCMMLLSVLCIIAVIPLAGQNGVNCFLEDWEPQYATIPPYGDVEKITSAPVVTITINATDTIGKISKYIFGNAVAVWLNQNQNNPELINHLEKLSPTLIRFPGGNWSNIYFWNGNPGDLPTVIPDGTNNGQPMGLNPKFGPNRPLTVDHYYDMRDQLYTQGLITINYSYARYGLSDRPAEQAAHYAAEWVRYDGGLTKFWEIGNENGGPWQAGWQIDTTLNKDGQPEIISGELYGKHFKIFADSMRAAAAELDETIYIGGQILHYDGKYDNWNPPNKKWNEGFFKEVGDAADFYVIHNYFGSSANARHLLDIASTEVKRNMDFIRQDIRNKEALLKPVALTEYNMHWDVGDLPKSSFINGMQSVILFCELITNNYGMSARWLIANWEADGMFYFREPALGIPLWNPRPAFFYAYYLQRFTGDHSVVAHSSSKDFLGYASTFHSGETAVVVVNKGKTSQVVTLKPENVGVGERFYLYSLTGGDDNGEFSQYVFVNENGPTDDAWGGHLRVWRTLKRGPIL